MRACLLFLILSACGDDLRPKADANHSHGDSGGSADAAPLTLECASYCTAITARCTGANQQYDSMQNCIDSCTDYPPGALTDTMGNTLGCRVYHTELAASDPATHCLHAGPSGGGACGTTCEGFCAIAVAECPGDWTANTCPNQCGMVTSTPPYAVPSTGNTIECRLYHATMAASDPTTHCPHTVKNNNPVCQ